MRTIGEAIRELRTARGLSLEELAEQMNKRYGSTINKGMISKWENGIGDPRLENVRQLAVFFDVSLDHLLGIKQTVEVETIAAHHDGEEWTEEELEEIEAFKRFVKMKRQEKQ